MNTEVLNPKSALLLEAGLNVLHFESQEWLGTIDFWKDEIKFFDILLKKKEPQEDHQKDFRKILEDLEGIHVNLFKYMENDIIAHEKILSRLQKNEKGVSDSIYRENHRKLMVRMDSFKNEFLKFKKIVFKFVKNL
ncbi:hypothetical protein [Polaribacter sp. SA4-12]|uniref:hypothetical protein n=1 Tax=Polaribacter sp. SA4-12 TaxID=1312072 RepID=UPI000B3C21BA|nr:hypothetical protein [Polaribacter sp. SA4-12]ARV14793.1 hypothetical protein BTO07_06355 [Polaribacter sp. SA4-12]